MAALPVAAAQPYQLALGTRTFQRPAAAAQAILKAWDQGHPGPRPARARPWTGLFAIAVTRCRGRPCQANKGDKGNEPGDDGSGSGFDKAKKKVEDWVNQKKAEAGGAAGGAVVGGLLGGPLGALVGSQVGTRVVPTLNNLVKGLEKVTDNFDEKESDDVDQKDRSLDKKALGTKKEVDVRQPEDIPLRPKVTEAAKPTQGRAQAAAPPTPSRATAPKHKAKSMPAPNLLAGELSSLKQGAALKRQKLEAEVSELYSKAEKALVAGDEVEARRLLAERSVSIARLTEITKGMTRRGQERCKELSAKVGKLYKEAEQALQRGDDEEARQLLAQWQVAKEDLQEAEENLRELDSASDESSP